VSRRKISYASCEGDDLADPLGSRPHKFNAPGDLFKAVDAFEAVVQPAYGINFTAFSKTRPIRWDVVMPAKGETPNPDALRKARDEVRAKLVAAIPKQAYEAPKKRRSCSSSRASTACRTTRFRTPT
jgi:hypothetical protein